MFARGRVVVCDNYVVAVPSHELTSRVPYLTAHQALGHPWPTIHNIPTTP